MAPRIDDRWVWLGFTAFFILAAKGLRYAIRDIIELTKVHPSHYQDDTATAGEQPEDTVSLDNLRILAGSPNFNISGAAIDIILSRFSKLPDAGNLLNKDLRSDNEDVARRARTTTRFLREHSVSLSALPRFPARISSIGSFSTIDEIPSGRTLSAAELASMLNGGIGGVDGGDAWVGEFVPNTADPVAGWTDVPRERPVDADDEEEAETRRRRREAMVLHEGLGALREDDIIRPRQ